MNWDTIQGKWEQVKGDAKVKWAKLTDDDLEQVKGHKDKLVGKIHERYGVAKDEASKQIDDWASKRN